MSDHDLEPWQWEDETWRMHVGRVRAGRSLAPESWPGGAQVAVAISFDSDHETIPLRDGNVTPGTLSMGEYGARVSIPRILRLLDKYEVSATFFIPAVSALLHEENEKEVTHCVQGGHEIGVHGWIHERTTLLPLEDERRLMERSIKVLEELSGARPVGIRTPSWDFSPNTLSIIRESGFLYDSSLMADDEPYEVLENGQPTGITEIPVHWIRDDAAYLMMNRFSSLRPYTPPRQILDIWCDEFDTAYATGGLFQLTMHPHIIGHRSRMVILEKLLMHIRSHTGVWFTTHAGLAEYVNL